MFNTEVSIYGIFIILAIFSGLFVTYKNILNLKYSKEENIAFLIYIGLGSLFGAKYYTFFTNFQRYNGVFKFNEIGLSSYGAVIGIIIMLFIFSKQYKKNLEDLLYAIIFSIPLMYGIGKIGCFFAGCCYGIEYNGPLNIVYNYSYSAPKGVSLFPIQLLEAIIFISIFIFSITIKKRVKSNSEMIGRICILCGISKFLLDFLRMSHTNLFLSLNQIVSIIFIFIGFIITKNRKNLFNIKIMTKKI